VPASAYYEWRHDPPGKIGSVWSHSDGSGFDVVIPAGVTVTGRIVCRKRKAPTA
jgi:hypothetical protein